jgi:hypothetical protein
MNRKLSDLASVAEIVAATGVILSLLFVGFEIRDGNQEARAATVQATSDSEMAFQSELLRYADTWEKVTRGVSLADGVELRRGIVLYNMMMTLNEDRYYQFKSGYLEKEPTVFTSTQLTSYPIYEMWRNSAGANSRSSEFLELLDRQRERGFVE